MSLSAPPAAGPPGGGAPPPASAGGGQGTLILQQVQALLAQLMQSETDPNIQQGVQELLKAIDPLMQAIVNNDAQAMNSGLNNPTGNVGPAGPDLAGGTQSSEGAQNPLGDMGPPPKGFGGARKAAMANFGSKGHFSKSGSKGEQLQTDKQKNRAKAK